MRGLYIGKFFITLNHFGIDIIQSRYNIKDSHSWFPSSYILQYHNVKNLVQRNWQTSEYFQHNQRKYRRYIRAYTNKNCVLKNERDINPLL